jgi:hypothetical protein
VVSKAIVETNYYKSSTIQGPHIEPYNMHLGLHSTGFHVLSQSSGGVLGHTNLPQHSRSLGISSTHNKFTSKA